MYCSNMAFGWTDRSNQFYDACDYYYSLNERLNVIDPPTWLQEKRFDIERARAMSPIVKDLLKPNDLDRYTVSPAPSTTVHPTWNTDHIALGDMCGWLTQLAQYYITPNSVPFRARIHTVLVDFIHRYDRAMTGKFHNVFPWGTNWYQFSITSTLMLFYFMLITTDENERTFAADLILKLIENPRKSLGANRDQANSVYMALPWITAHYFKGDVYEASRHPSYEYARSYIKFQTVEHRKDEGLYMDCTYITHTNVLAYGYLRNMTSMSLPLVGFDNLMRNFLLDWRRCQRILAHRTIKYGCVGFHSRDRVLTQFTIADSSYGIEVIPTCLFLRMYNEDYAFSMRGQVPWIAYYESDKSIDDMAQYWVQSRQVYQKKRDYTVTFPVIGFIYPKYTDTSAKQLVSSRCRIPTRTSTTTPLTNGPKRNTQPLKFGFVFAYGTVGILRHFYYTAEMTYDPKTQFSLPKSRSAHGRYWVDEFVLCDYQNHTIDTWTNITKNFRGDLMLYGSESYLMDEYTGGGIFHIHQNCKSGQISQSFATNKSTVDEIATKYPRGVTVVNTDTTVMLLDHGKPKMAMYPDGWLDLKSNFVTKYDGKEYEFAFDSLTNQYWLSGQCIEKM